MYTQDTQSQPEKETNPKRQNRLKKAEEMGYRDTNSLPWKEMHKAERDNLYCPNPGPVLTTESL